jgi:ribosomal 50S subunit-associated protein YjgA (DUF615 family)
LASRPWPHAGGHHHSDDPTQPPPKTPSAKACAIFSFADLNFNGIAKIASATWVCEPLRAALAGARGDSVAATARLHRLERLRDALLEDETKLYEIAALYPVIDPQHLRSLRRAALKEKEKNKPPRNYRAIFQLLKDADQESGNPATDV